MPDDSPSPLHPASSAGPPSFAGLSRQSQAVVDRLCDAFEEELKRTGSASIEGYLARIDAELQRHLLRELVALEIEHGQRRGQPTTDQSEYLRRFPALDETWLTGLFQSHRSTVSPELGASTGRRHLPEPPASIDEYDLLAELGRGGMGRVYRARHRRMDREVAIKMLNPDLLADAGALRRFHREVTMAAKLVHPNIVTAYDAREHDGLHFLVMEYVRGHDLKSVVADQGQLPVRTTIDYVIQAAKGLECAHRQGIVHRDVKPSNLLLDEHGIVKVLDLGLARLDSGRSTEAGRLTAPHSVLGTLAFMAPEQSGDPGGVDHRADIYGLGCTWFFLLTAQPPYAVKGVMDLVRAHQRQPLPPLSLYRQDVPSDVEEVLRKMVAKRPSDRPASMREAVDLLTHLIESPPRVPPPQPTISPSMAGVPLQPTPRLSADSSPTEARSRQRSSRTHGTSWAQAAVEILPGGRPAWLVAIGLLFVVVLGVYAVFQYHRRSELEAGGETGTAPVLGASAGSGDQQKDARLIGVIPFQSARAQQLQAQWASKLGQEISLTNRWKMEFRLIPPGEFSLGGTGADDAAERRVRIDRPFWLQRTETTVGQFRAFVKATGYRTTESQGLGGWGLVGGQWTQRPEFDWSHLGEQPASDQHPAVSISWLDAMAFCRWLSEQERVVYRLPTEAEWEFACRAGSPGAVPSEAEGPELTNCAWYLDNAGGLIQPVGQKRPNAFGLCDLLGNEMEWCLDVQSELTGEAARNSSSGRRVLRGGAFNEPATGVNAVSRFFQEANSPTHGAFRVLREVPE